MLNPLPDWFKPSIAHQVLPPLTWGNVPNGHSRGAHVGAAAEVVDGGGSRVAPENGRERAGVPKQQRGRIAAVRDDEGDLRTRQFESDARMSAFISDSSWRRCSARGNACSSTVRVACSWASWSA